MYRHLSAVTITLLMAACSQGNLSSATTADATSPGVESQRAVNAQPRGLAANALRVQMVDIMDRNGFEQPMPAPSGFIPVGWTGARAASVGAAVHLHQWYNVEVAGDVAGWHASHRQCCRSTAGRQTTTARHRARRVARARRSAVQQYLTQLAQQSAWRAGAGIPAPAGHRREVCLSRQLAHPRPWARCAPGSRPARPSSPSTKRAATCAASSRRRDLLAVAHEREWAWAPWMPSRDSRCRRLPLRPPRSKFKPQFIEAMRQSFLPNPAWEARISQHNTAISRVAQQEAAEAQPHHRRDQRLREPHPSRDRRLPAKSDERRQREVGRSRSAAPKPTTTPMPRAARSSCRACTTMRGA